MHVTQLYIVIRTDPVIEGLMMTHHPDPDLAELSVMNFPSGDFVHVHSVCSK